MPGYENYNLGKDGYFWRGVAPDWSALDDTSLCSRLMFWQDAGEVPDEPEAPTPEVLAAYAYDKVKVPETEIELKPAARSTVNLPTWVWLDKAAFKKISVRAELPARACGRRPPPRRSRCTWTRGRRTRRPTRLRPLRDQRGRLHRHAVHPGQRRQDPPCGIRYLRASGGEPYRLTASITCGLDFRPRPSRTLLRVRVGRGLPRGNSYG